MASMITSSAGERVDFDFFDTPRNNIESLESLDENNRIYEGPHSEKSSEKHGDVSFRAKEKKYSDSESSDSEIDSDVDSESDKSYSSEGSTARIRSKTKQKKTSKKGGSYSYSSDSSTYSDDSSGDESRIIEEERRKAQKKESRYNRPNDKTKEAWGQGIERIDITKKTPSTEDLSKRENKSSNGKSGSDSEMTDVSPLPSPRDLDNGHVQYSDQVNDYSGEVQLKSKQLDLSILMDAVSEIDKQQRLKSNRRVMFEPPKSHCNDKSNFTFDTHRAKLIEKENQRLLKEIMRHIGPNQPKKKRSKPHAVSAQRVTPSAINRQRDQRRIESENMQFLQRLQHTRPTRGLSRTEQLTEYKHTLLHGVPIAAMHTSPVPNKTFGEGNITLGSTLGSTGRRSRPSSAKSNASTIRSRPGSAKSIASSVVSRPCSAKSTSRSVDNRPAWNDRFAFS